MSGSSSHSHLSAELACFHPPLKSTLGKGTGSFSRKHGHKERFCIQERMLDTCRDA